VGKHNLNNKTPGYSPIQRSILSLYHKTRTKQIQKNTILRPERSDRETDPAPGSSSPGVYERITGRRARTTNGRLCFPTVEREHFYFDQISFDSVSDHVATRSSSPADQLGSHCDAARLTAVPGLVPANSLRRLTLTHALRTQSKSHLSFILRIFANDLTHVVLSYDFPLAVRRRSDSSKFSHIA